MLGFKREKPAFNFERELLRIRREYADCTKKLREPEDFERILPVPEWMEGDPLEVVYTEQPELFRQKRIYYACFVQANDNLFKVFPPYNCPAEILYSTEEEINRNPLTLVYIAKRLFEYKQLAEENRTDEIPEELRQLAAELADETGRSFNVPLGMVMEDGRTAKFYLTTIMVFRRHLPGRRIKGPLAPVFAAPETLKTALVVPWEFWTEELEEAVWQG